MLYSFVNVHFFFFKYSGNVRLQHLIKSALYVMTQPLNYIVYGDSEVDNTLFGSLGVLPLPA